MITKDQQTVMEATQSSMDDFKLIRRIGSSVEDRLHRAGISTYKQLAELSPHEIAEILKDLIGWSPDRIVREDWIGQASKCASERYIDETDKDTNVSNGSQHYAGFTLQLLLDERNNVCRTTVMHVQSREQMPWAGWDGERLLDFIIQQANLPIPARTEVVIASPPATSSESVEAGQRAEKVKRQTTSSEITGRLRLLNLEPATVNIDGPKHLIQENRSFNFHLTMDLTEVKSPAETPIKYLATIYAKGLGSNSRQNIGSAQGIITPLANNDIDVPIDGLACGIYRIDAIVLLSPPDQEPKPGSGPVAVIEGGIFQVY